ncbi:hypothetical protein RFI_18688 [Reticulomyxa filosa]|uniref:Uncharacterized protein n=1 Tax=Reticulomyxa filosa TaxID=46433 RepID=X6MX35_RETFI|nr:hypothetical protein RFI_18688 [Reticulomyxa filosa]|eukprot:ETO18578.1 hypothetical protein RFI_18688 [Reticulomyxa filosa]
MALTNNPNSFPESVIQQMVLDTLYDILRIDRSHTEAILKLGLLQRLDNPLQVLLLLLLLILIYIHVCISCLLAQSKNKSLIIKALTVVSAVVADSGFVEVCCGLGYHVCTANINFDYNRSVFAVAMSGFVSTMLGLLKKDDLARLKVVRILKFMSRNRKVAFKLVKEHDMIKCLGDALSEFKKYDPILKEVYQHVGPCYNFEFVEDVIGMLICIIYYVMTFGKEQIKINVYY